MIDRAGQVWKDALGYIVLILKSKTNNYCKLHRVVYLFEPECYDDIDNSGTSWSESLAWENVDSGLVRLA